jgi:glycylpeptide N-tetradecanoyltransferase
MNCCRQFPRNASNTLDFVSPTADEVADCGPIDSKKTVKDVRQSPHPLPSGFEWSDVNVSDEGQLRELYTLLSENYVEDDDNMFRFDYSAEFLRWAVNPPGFKPDWLVGLRRSKTNTLMAFIAGIPVQCQVHTDNVSMCEINFLCIHKKLRSKRLAPVLIKEVTRRVNLTDTWQAVYTAGIVLPKPVSACGYFHRPINSKKLVEVGFSRTSSRMTLPRMVRLNKLPDTVSLPNVREMTPDDVPVCFGLLHEYLKKFKLYLHFETEADFAHWILPRQGVVNSYVVDTPGKGVTDFFSFYHLPSSVIGNDKHDKLHAVYAFYTVPGEHCLTTLMETSLIMARNAGADVFNALDLQENGDFLKQLKFGPGDGRLQYYLYNWKCPSMESSDVGLVML